MLIESSPGPLPVLLATAASFTGVRNVRDEEGVSLVTGDMLRVSSPLEFPGAYRNEAEVCPVDISIGCFSLCVQNSLAWGLLAPLHSLDALYGLLRAGSSAPSRGSSNIG